MREGAEDPPLKIRELSARPEERQFTAKASRLVQSFQKFNLPYVEPLNITELHLQRLKHESSISPNL